jgi:hypothetical protein
MTLSGRQELLQWFGLLAAPLAWATHLVSGYYFAEAHCGSLHWSSGWARLEILVTIVAALVAVLAEWAAATVYLDLRTVGRDAAGPAGRRRFLVTAALVANVLFFFGIVLSGVTVVAAESCRQG